MREDCLEGERDALESGQVCGGGEVEGVIWKVGGEGGRVEGLSGRLGNCRGLEEGWGGC